MNDARKDLHRSFRLHRNVSWRRICPELSLSFVKCPSPTSSVVVVVVVLYYSDWPLATTPLGTTIL